MTYYYSKTEKQTKYSTNVDLKIYKIEKKVPILLAEHRFNTASTMGIESEVFQGLVFAGILPARYKNIYALNIPHKAYLL